MAFSILFSATDPTMAARNTRVPTMTNPMTCELCRLTFSLTKPTEVDISVAELPSSGWMDFARKGVVMTSWMWRCPKCKPGGKVTSFTSTPYGSETGSADGAAGEAASLTAISQKAAGARPVG